MVICLYLLHLEDHLKNTTHKQNTKRHITVEYKFLRVTITISIKRAVLAPLRITISSKAKEQFRGKLLELVTISVSWLLNYALSWLWNSTWVEHCYMQMVNKHFLNSLIYTWPFFLSSKLFYHKLKKAPVPLLIFYRIRFIPSIED